MNFADILNVCRTGPGVYLPCSVSTADNSLSYRNPRIVVAEDAGILLVSRWIRRDFTNLSAYDQGCNEEFQKAMKDYFEGNCDKDTAIETFKKAVIEKYPDLAE